MTLSISFSIMGVPERLPNIRILYKELFPKPILCIDEQYRGLWWNANRAWLRYDPAKEYHAVIQDDVQLCKNFMERLENVMSQVSSPCYTLYQSMILHKEIRLAYKEGFNFISLDRTRTAQCIIIKTSLIRRMISWINETIKPNETNTHDDENISAWLQKHKLRAILPIPELLRHTGIFSSTIGHSGDYEEKLFIDQRSRINTQTPRIKIVDTFSIYDALSIEQK